MLFLKSMIVEFSVFMYVNYFRKILYIEIEN